jgi:hypothetical protein
MKHWWLLFCFGLTAWGQIITERHHSQVDMDCRECHLCELPTHKRPCLKLFPDFRREGVSMDQSAQDAPTEIMINGLAKRYEGVLFSHQLHAEMAEMSGGCASCHHHNPPGKVLACIDCHGEASFNGLARPGLRGAYHRQCLDCHQQWSKATDCQVCHLEKGKERATASLDLAAVHEPLKIPQKVVFDTDEDEGPLVTFYHDDHHDRFGIGCAQCHANERCSRCHDRTQNLPKVKEDPHDQCFLCHEQAIDDDCGKCHDHQERPRFDHLAKGWELNRFHKELRCDSCHKKNEKAKLSKQCLDCHEGWKNGRFDHSVTGLLLDEEHEDLDCSDCHQNQRFDGKTSCDECHDDYQFPDDLPGTRLRR